MTERAYVRPLIVKCLHCGVVYHKIKVLIKHDT